MKIEDYLTDDDHICLIEDSMDSIIDDYQYAIKHGKQLVFGLDLKVSFGDVQPPKAVYNRTHHSLSVVAMNKEGIKELVRLLNYANEFGFYKVHRVDVKTLRSTQNLIGIINDKDSLPALHVKHGHEDKAKFVVDTYHEIFGGRVFVERHTKSAYFDSLPYTSYLTNIVRYKSIQDFTLYKTLVAISRNIQLDQLDLDNDGFNYGETPDGLIDMCQDYNIQKINHSLPFFITEADFRVLLIQKLKDFGLVSDEYTERLNTEVELITRFGFHDYFMLIVELIEYSKSLGSLYLSAGRGSVGGSLVAYLLGITRVDPVNTAGFSMGILFSRFLNAGRKVLPDIDLDFLPKDRQAIIQYLKDKYGDGHIANIGVKMRFGARSSVRDVARITGVLDSEMSAIIKAFPKEQKLTLEDVKNSDIYKSNLNNQEFTTVFDVAEALEKQPKSTGVHASGIAFSKDALWDMIPYSVKDGLKVTQYDQHQVDYLGVIKLDILGVNALQIVEQCVRSIWQDDPDFDLFSIPLDDIATFKHINTKNLTGVFQWASHVYHMVIKDMRPATFQELVDLNALGRSASIMSGLTDMYIKRKHKRQDIEPLHPKLLGLMEHTYELPLYQEQIMKIFIELADYTESEADDVRRAIGKKKASVMAEQEVQFKERAMANGVSEADVVDIWAVIVEFSRYTWNMGHAVSYTKICYETAYLSANYPAHYYCACMSNSDKDRSKYVSLIKKANIELRPASINKSQREYTSFDGVVVSGLYGIKFFGEKSLEYVLNDRVENGEYASIEDFCERIPKKVVNKTSMKALISAGAFEEFEDVWSLYDRLGDVSLSSIYLDQYRLCGRVAIDVVSLVDKRFDEIKDLTHKKTVEVLAYVVELREIYTKNGKAMAFMVIEDFNGTYEVVIFPSIWSTVSIKVADLCEMSVYYKDGYILGGANAHKI